MSSLDEKKDLIVNCIGLGMDLYRAQIISSCTDSEIEILNNDKEFLDRVKMREFFLEKELLELHEKARNISVTKGDSRSIQWMLEKINPDKWDMQQTKKVALLSTTLNKEDISKDDETRLKKEFLNIFIDEIQK